MKLALASDHGGYELKQLLRKYLEEQSFEIIDCGNSVYDSKDDYPDFAHALAKTVSEGKVEKGILLCGSGVGASITANKVKGVRACVCHDTYSAHQGVEHDNMNVLCLGARIVGSELAKELVTAFVNAKFINEGRFKRRLDKVEQIEKEQGR
jgi:ribose 5-phosphate isomerase B